MPLIRQQMEDGYTIKEKYLGVEHQTLVAVFDGHGSRLSMEYCRDNVHDVLAAALTEFQGDITKAFEETFAKLDAALPEIGADTGTTATVCLARIEEGQQVVYTANVGDSTSYIVGVTESRKTATVHTGRTQKELSRVMKSGGRIRNGRVEGMLAVTRALGDFHMKSHGVISIPSVDRQVILPGDKYLVVASDGIWDKIKPKGLQELAGDGSMNSAQLAKILVETVIKKQTRDNITVFVGKLFQA
jgi:serine/threonine protein phosphatase PrpC